MNKTLMIKEVMTLAPYSIGPDASLYDALELMKRHKIHHIPVRDQGEIIGILTDRDATLALSLAESEEEKNLLTVYQTYSPDPFTVAPTESLDNVLAAMVEYRLGSAVVAEHGKLLGIFTVTDACRFFLRYLRSS